MKVSQWHFRPQQLLQRRMPSLILGLLILLLLGGTLFLLQPVLAPKPSVTLHILVQNLEIPQWKPLIEEFNKKYQMQHINIELVEGPDATDSIEKIYANDFKGEDEPFFDLVYMDIIWVAKFAHEKWLDDLTGKFSKEELENFLPNDVEGGRLRGNDVEGRRLRAKLYRIPFHSDVGMLYYREDLLEDKPPETFEDLMAISKDLQQKDKVNWGYLWQGQQYEGLVAMFLEVLHGYDGFWIRDETGKVGLNQPEALKAVEFLLSTISKDKEKGISPKAVTVYQEEETRLLFQKGEAVFLRNWPYVWARVNTEDTPVRGKIQMKPMVHARGNRYRSYACQGGWGLGISSKTKHKVEALEAIKFFTSADIQWKYALKTGNAPSRRALFNDPQLVKRYSYYPMLLEVLENNSVLRPRIPNYEKVSFILQDYLHQALEGQLDPQKAMIEAADKTCKELKNVGLCE